MSKTFKKEEVVNNSDQIHLKTTSELVEIFLLQLSERESRLEDEIDQIYKDVGLSPDDWIFIPIRDTDRILILNEEIDEINKIQKKFKKINKVK